MAQSARPPRRPLLLGTSRVLLLGLVLVAVVLAGVAGGVEGRGTAGNTGSRSPLSTTTPSAPSETPSETGGGSPARDLTTGNPRVQKVERRVLLQERQASAPVSTDLPPQATKWDRKLARKVQKLLTGPEVEVTPARFRIGTFNVLGSSHTAKGGNKKGWASGLTRMAWTVQLLRELDVDVVGFQEFELIQYKAFARMTRARFDVFPGPSLGRNAIRNSIAWRRDTWRLVAAHTIEIPYFYGNRVPMPYVLLEHLPSGQRIYFVNVHNPATTKRRGDNERWRDLATELQIRLVNRLHRTTASPVVLTGDFNEREEVFCRITSRAKVNAANGGSAAGGRCVPPPEIAIDWIFGSRSITFSGYLRKRDGLARRASDHPFIVAQAELGSAVLR